MQPEGAEPDFELPEDLNLDGAGEEGGEQPEEEDQVGLVGALQQRVWLGGPGASQRLPLQWMLLLPNKLGLLCQLSCILSELAPPDPPLRAAPRPPPQRRQG